MLVDTRQVSMRLNPYLIPLFSWNATGQAMQGWHMMRKLLITENTCLASTIASMVACSCGLNLPSGMFAFLVTYMQLSNEKNSGYINWNELYSIIKISDLSISNDNKNMILTITSFNNINWCPDKWGKWSWTYKLHYERYFI